MTFLVLAVVALPMGVLVMTSSIRLRLAIAALLAVPQVYLPGLPQSLSAFKIWVVLIGVAALVDMRRRLTPVERVLACLVLACGVAAFWSPQPQAALFAMVSILCVAIVSAYARAVQVESPRGLSTVMSIVAGWVLVESALVVIFRVQPTIEDHFYRSPLAVLLIGGQRLEGFFGQYRDNAMSLDKAGGLWLNANTASMFLGAAAWAFVWAFVVWRRRLHAVAAVVAFIAVPFTGSKTGVVLLVAVAAVAFVLQRLSARYQFAGVAVLGLMAFPLYMAVTRMLELLPSAFRSDSTESIGSRTLIWSVARELFGASPVLGLGFGGWTEAFASRIGDQLASRLPPHNTFIVYWANGGLLSLTLLAVFWLVVVAECVGMLARATWSRWGSVALCGSLLWVFLHGMGDAVDFYGDERSLLLFGVLLGAVFVGGAHRQVADAAAPPRRTSLVSERRLLAGARR